MQRHDSLASPFACQPHVPDRTLARHEPHAAGAPIAHRSCSVADMAGPLRPDPDVSGPRTRPSRFGPTTETRRTDPIRNVVVAVEQRGPTSVGAADLGGCGAMDCRRADAFSLRRRSAVLAWPTPRTRSRRVKTCSTALVPSPLRAHSVQPGQQRPPAGSSATPQGPGDLQKLTANRSDVSA